DRRRGEGFRLSGGRIRAQLCAGTGANLNAAARDQPGDADGPYRLWSDLDRGRGEGFRLSGGRIRAQLCAGTGANLNAAARDQPGDADGPYRLWSVRRVTGIRRE